VAAAWVSQAKHKQWDDTSAKVAAMVAAGQKSRKRLTDMARAKKPGAELVTEYQVRLPMPLFPRPVSRTRTDEFVRVARATVCLVHASHGYHGGLLTLCGAGVLDRRRWRVC